MAEARFEPERVIAELNQAGVDYIVVGGLAVGAHGVVRATRDLAIVPGPALENIARLAAVRTRHGEVHVLNRMPGTPDFDDLKRDRVLVEVEEGNEAPVCSLEHLRQMKRASERPRDTVDLAELDELHGPADE